MKKKTTCGWFAAAILALVAAQPAVADDNIYVFRKGNLVYKNLASAVDSIATNHEADSIKFYAADHSVLYEAKKSQVDSITFKYYKPQADLLDVVFHTDGTAQDVSPMKNTVQNLTKSGTEFEVVPNNVFEANIAKFRNQWGGFDASHDSYYKVDYSANTAFKNALADGHSFETLFRAHYSGNIKDSEAKWFSAHQGGGTGFLISKISGARKNEITFLPNVSTNGKSNWIWATSGVVPQNEVYYHVVGVWNKEEGKAYVYVNGELKNVVSAKGSLVFPGSTTAQWIGIGADAHPNNGECSGSWDVVTARIYDRSLNAEDVALLWDDVQTKTHVPVADVLDVKFNEDGSAVDVSPMKNTIRTITDGSVLTKYDEVFERYVGSFNNTFGSTASQHFRVDYANNNEFIKALQDGHTLEAYFMANYSAPLANQEYKMFSSHQGGGTGLMVSKTSGSRGQELTFLPNVSNTGSGNYCWATSGITPKSNTYYHVVGVWNKEEGKAHIYVNGELKNTVDAKGNFYLPSAECRWFGIGADPGGAERATEAWNGDVVLARIYDKALSSHDVAVLWNELESYTNKLQTGLVSDVDYLSGVIVRGGMRYPIDGNGFAQGDVITLTSAYNGAVVSLPVTLVPDKGVTVELPQEIESDTYTLTLLRGEETQKLGRTTLHVRQTTPKGSKVIAHRGYWDTEGSTQNSLASLREAIAANCYGSEVDVYITTDGHVVANHDATYNGLNIERSTYAQVKNLTLSNGEKMPTLRELLSLLDENSDTKLIIEIKTHASEERGIAAVDSSMAIVKEMGKEDRVEYIAFSYNLCREVVRVDSTAKIAYLNGDKAPAQLHAVGITGLDYTAAVLRANPSWISSARNLGMTTNVWTINSASEIVEMNNMGVDYITTDNPLYAKKVYDFYAANYIEQTDSTTVPTDSLRADLLDIRFNEDGTVQDVSPMKNRVQVVSPDGKTISTAYNETYGTYMGRFSNTWGGMQSDGTQSYCKVDYSNNFEFKEKLLDGHTFETLFCAHYEGTIPNKEAKWFSAHQAGGTGFLISNISGARKNEITFLPNITTTGSSKWIWTTSGVVPQSDVFYHVVGVWNKEEGKTYIYVNGELKNTVDAPGSFRFPAESVAQWVGIGCDAHSNGGEVSGKWDIVSARIYDLPLSANTVQQLWQKVNKAE